MCGIDEIVRTIERARLRRNMERGREIEWGRKGDIERAREIGREIGYNEIGGAPRER